MKKILGSIVTIAAVSGLAFGATSAFFSDTETSEGNVLAAGAIDLQIDNKSYAIDWNIPDFSGDPQGEFVLSQHTTWELENLDLQHFFDFEDLKPGDYGEDTISVQVDSNEAWICAAANITADHDNTYVDPELVDDTSVVEGDAENQDGELDEGVNFAFWLDDGDNVFEDDEETFLTGPISALEGAGQIALADSGPTGVFGDGEPAPGGSTFYIGKIWCFGELTEQQIDENSDFGPLGADQAPGGQGDDEDRGTGFTCDGEFVNNAAQTDIVEGDLEFYAEQARNNPEFLCENWQPSWELEQ